MEKFLKPIDEKKMTAILDIKNRYNEDKISLEEARAEIKQICQKLRPYEIALAEQRLKEFEEDECQKEDIQAMLEIFQDVMTTTRPELPNDHPLQNYYRENDAMRSLLLEMEDLVQYPVIKNQWLEIYDRLNQYKVHFSRKQNQLYPMLEKKGFDRPTTTMWTLDDFIRDEIRQGRELLDLEEETFISFQWTLIADMRDLMDKEDIILYPTAFEMLSEKEFEEMKEGDLEIGFFGFQKDPVKKEKKEIDNTSNELKEDLQKLLVKHGYAVKNDEKLEVSTGQLTLDQINLIYKHMPVDLSFVDEKELVCFYTDTKHRVFPRSKNVIGRDVKNCHPRKSVHLVEEIVQKFRSGEKDHAEFWIDTDEAFIYIYYTAVRDEDGTFRGVLEMMQDCTHIRSLKGSRTLLTWDEEQNVQREEKEQNEQKDEQTDIEITGDTKIKDLFDRYAWLKEELPKKYDVLKILNTPLARVMIPKATITKMSERSGIKEEDLIESIKGWIRDRES